jgi:hypothetical protein
MRDGRTREETIMSEIIDRVAKSLAAGVPRRQVLRWGGGLGALLPFADAAAHDRFKHLEQYCQDWCQIEFTGPHADACVSKAKKGKGPCYSSSGRGPGFVCTKKDPCPSHKRCCPTVVGTPVTRVCCSSGQECVGINETVPFCQ